MGMARGERQGDRDIDRVRGETVAGLAILAAAYTRDASAAEEVLHETLVGLRTEPRHSVAAA